MMHKYYNNITEILQKYNILTKTVKSIAKSKQNK